MKKKYVKQKKKKSKKGSRFGSLAKVSESDRKFGRIYLGIVIVMALATAILVIYSMS